MFHFGCEILKLFCSSKTLQSTGSSLALVFGLENCVDFFSSAVVLWRFFAPSKVDPLLEELLNGREQRASIAISFILVILGLVVMATAIDDYTKGNEEPDQLDEILAVSFFSVVIFGTLASFKFHYSNCLESPSLYKDGLCSLIGTVLAGTLFINTLIIRENSDFWWIDPLVSLMCGIGSLLLGLWHLYQARYKENIPILSLHWWVMSQGDGKSSSVRQAGDVPSGLNESTNPELEMNERAEEGEVV